MPAHAVVTFTELENHAPKFGMPEGMEARFGREALGLETIGCSHYVLPAGVRVPFGHRHPGGPEFDEVYVVLSGSARIRIEEDYLDLEAGQAVRVPGDAMRSFEGGREGARILAFGGHTPDFEMDREWWTD